MTLITDNLLPWTSPSMPLTSSSHNDHDNTDNDNTNDIARGRFPMDDTNLLELQLVRHDIPKGEPMPERPQPLTHFDGLANDDEVHKMLSVWDFLAVFR